MRAKAWAVLISGRGSNLSSLLDDQDEMNVKLVVSSSASAGGLVRARRAGVRTKLAPLMPGSKPGTKKIDWPLLTKQLRAQGITDICLAGFMRIVPRDFVLDWENHLINLHPSLLPDYPGLDSIQRAHTDQADIGVTIHFVNEDVDAGEIILKRRCLKKREVRRYSLGLTEFLVHVTEQRLLKFAVSRRNSQTSFSEIKK